eukprot:1593569-Prymnesium_polylepis.1
MPLAHNPHRRRPKSDARCGAAGTPTPSTVASTAKAVARRRAWAPQLQPLRRVKPASARCGATRRRAASQTASGVSQTTCPDALLRRLGVLPGATRPHAT